MKRLFVLLQRILPQHLLSRIVGAVAKSRLRIIHQPFIWVFIRAFGVELADAERQDPSDYDSFNDFFTRRLRAEARPVSGTISSPADGRVSVATGVEGNQLVQAKGLSYSLEKLLATTDTAGFQGGSFITIYLSPKDYHRVHMPVAGTLVRAQYVPGRLYSVNETTTGLVPDLFADNERLVSWFETDHGPMCMVMVGAMIVAGIKTVWRESPFEPRQYDSETFDAPWSFAQGEEFGQFQMGSTVILVFPEKLNWKPADGDAIRMGEPLV